MGCVGFQGLRVEGLEAQGQPWIHSEGVKGIKFKLRGLGLRSYRCVGM